MVDPYLTGIAAKLIDAKLLVPGQSDVGAIEEYPRGFDHCDSDQPRFETVNRKWRGWIVNGVLVDAPPEQLVQINHPPQRCLWLVAP